MGQSKEMYETTLPVLYSQRTELRRELDWSVFLTDKYHNKPEESLDLVITEFFDRMSNTGNTQTSVTEDLLS
jgi:hypothetical protein